VEKERMVVAIRTTKIAIGKEKHGTNLPCPIRKGGL